MNPQSIAWPDGILQHATCAHVIQEGEQLRLTGCIDGRITLKFTYGPAFVLDQAANGWYLLPASEDNPTVAGRSIAWVLPQDPDATDGSWMITTEGEIVVQTDKQGENTVTVTIYAEQCVLTSYDNRPQADCFGKRFKLEIEDGASFAHTLACFYWGTVLPSVVERTRAANYPDSDGYVLSTLIPSAYAGTYPDVDHEFQIKGRTAMGNDLDDAIIRRMLELQIRLMREDPEKLWRNPCAVQPDGTREYHVRRSSMDGQENAVMFLVTGNVEILETAWLYTASTKNYSWLAEHIGDLENAASGVEDYIDRYDRLWSDVYYEDQVIKDGREAFATSLAAYSFARLAELETQLSRHEQAAHYASLSARLAKASVLPLPDGYWDEQNGRFVDWIDRRGGVHDHIHLLANILPVLFGHATDSQRDAVFQLVEEKFGEFQRFPSFIAADIAAYTDSEIGDGGPYDLCAAGRYWFWDAAFWSWRGRGDRLKAQLNQVARQAATEGYVMGERYDMNHVFYIDDKNWHGAGHYYEYPNVFAWVLIEEYLGVRSTLTADVRLAPKLADYGRIELNQARWALAYRYAAEGFTLTNLSDAARSFEVDLTVLYPGVSAWRIAGGRDGDGIGKENGFEAGVGSKPVERAGNGSKPDAGTGTDNDSDTGAGIATGTISANGLIRLAGGASCTLRPA